MTRKLTDKNNNDTSVGGASLFVTDVNFVQQYVLITSNFGPNYGRNGGSVVNMITPSGLNAWHADPSTRRQKQLLFECVEQPPAQFQKSGNRPILLPALHVPIMEFTGGFTVGGPILKNKAFIFGGFDDHYYLCCWDFLPAACKLRRLWA